MPPILTPGPTKKSKVAGTRVHFAEEDPEDIFEKHDQHITAVISKIIVSKAATSIYYKGNLITKGILVILPEKGKTGIWAPFTRQIFAQNRSEFHL